MESLGNKGSLEQSTISLESPTHRLVEKQNGKD